MNLWDKISSLIQDGKDGTEGAPAADRAPEDLELDKAGAPPLTTAAANGVLTMLPKGQSLDQFAAGQIQLLNLESVRTELGDRWPKVEHQVHLLVEATLRKILTPSDIFTQIDEFEYLVIFPNLTEQKASALMYVAAAQIRQKLFGRDPAFAAIRLNATVTRVTRGAVQNAADPVAALHEAALLGQPAEPGPELEEKLLSDPAFRPWTDKYKIIPIKGGGMSQGHLVADAPHASGPTLDFSGYSERPAGTATGGASGGAVTADGSQSGQTPAGYPVVATTGRVKTEQEVATGDPRPQGRLPDFSSMVEKAAGRSTIGSTVVGSHSESQERPATEGYRVTPITRGGTAEAHMIQDAPRAASRIPDFASATPGPAQTSQAPAAVAAGPLRAPALSARLDALMTKSPPQKAIQITRPSEGPAAGAATAEASVGVPGGQTPAPRIEEVQLLYEPIWDVRRQAVTTYRMKVSVKVEGELIGLNEFSMTYDDPNLQFTINSLILRKLVSHVQHGRGEKRKAFTVAPIGRRFIEDESGLRFVFDQLGQLTEQERQLVILEIGDAYFGSWPALAPRLGVIRRVCRNIGIRLSLDHKDFQQVAATGATVASGDLADHDWPERQTLGALNAFAAAASKASLRSFVGGLTTSSMVIAAVCAGFDHLSGSAIGEGTPTPLGVYPLSTEGFYLQRQAQRIQPDQGNGKSG